MGKPELLQLQSALGLGSQWGVIDVPREWMPAGSASADQFRIQDLNAVCGTRAAPQELKELAVTVATRYVLMLFMAPNPVAGCLKPSTSMFQLVMAKALFRAAVKKPQVAAGYLLNRLTEMDTGSLSADTEIRRMRYWASKGWWDDLPQAELYQTHEPSRLNNVPPASHKGTGRRDPWLPLPDEFVADAGARVLWIVEQLGPAVIDCTEGLLKLCESVEPSKWAEKTAEKKRSMAAQEYLSSFVWKDVNGSALQDLPFPFIYAGITRSEASAPSWPPRYASQIRSLLRLIQACHLFIVLLSTGARIGEALSMKHGCLVESTEGNGLIRGRTFKLTAFRGGEERDWPLPEIGVAAIKQQERVSECIRRWNRITNKVKDFREVDSIWRFLRQNDVDNDAADVGYNEELRIIVKGFNLAASLGEKPMHAHRCRKTLARLLALCIVGAPKIVMDLFGHRDIEMTLSYILSDPLIRAEMEEVARAQTILLAADAMAHADENGGPAAKLVKEAVAQEQIRLAKDKLGVDDLRDLADTATLSGKTWSLVRPGVVCTKGPKQAGPCTRNVGAPEPSRCRSYCDHRLEEYFLSDEVEQTLSVCVAELDTALKSDEFHQADYWIGQICANINRFAAIREKWKGHPMVEYALRNSTQRTVS
jgi:integrase